MQWTLTLERKSENRLCEETVRKHVKHIAKVAERNAALGFRGRAGKLGEPQIVFEDGQEKKRYFVRLRLEESKARTPEIGQQRFEHIRRQIERFAGKKGWKIIDTEGGNQEVVGRINPSVLEDQVLGEVQAEPRTPFRPRELTPEIIRDFFADIYERDSHLRIINDAVQTHVLTNGDLRSHTLLYGEPGGCKSTLLERLKPLYDDQFERLAFIDTSTATKAGLERWILEHAQARVLPEILVLEEIEKCDKDNLLALGSILASGYIMRTNANIGRVREDCRFLLLATCNDEVVLRQFRRGFLWDRFTNHLRCTLPDEAMMYKILLNKVARIPGGKEVWADLAMDFSRTMKVKRPRKIIGYLAGRSRLETGEYQQDIIRIEEAARKENELLGGRSWRNHNT
jgi:hypothetical protein